MENILKVKAYRLHIRFGSLQHVIRLTILPTSSKHSRTLDCLLFEATLTMAVLDKLEADVRVDGQPLLEYENNDPEEDSRPQTVVKYVEAPTDAAFAIHVRISKDYQMTSEGVIFMFEADGKGLTKKTVAQEELHGRASDKEVVVNGRRGRYESGALNRRPLRFTEINFGKPRSVSLCLIVSNWA